MHTPDQPTRALKRRSHAPVRNTASPPQQPPRLNTAWIALLWISVIALAVFPFPWWW